MKVRLVRIGNSRGIRIPQELLRVYGLQEGAELELEERREGILLSVQRGSRGLLPWKVAYQEMAAESAEAEEWSEWDATAGDGRES
jgi:antitoxin component of MazEF toxin-antitoxin module